MDEINKLRNLIDSIDEQLFKLISSRAELVKQIGEQKRKNDFSIVDKKREEEIFEKIIAKARKNNLDEKAIKQIWENLIDISYKIEGGK